MPQPHYYITTAIDYVNAAPHLGHAYEKVATDVMVRFRRLLGESVFFLTGTDEHGTKVAETAIKQGVSPKEYVDGMVTHFQETWDYLNLTYDRFIRTTDADHQDVVHFLWQTMLDKGDIYKDSYEGKYCSGCECFLSERDLDEAGACKIHRVSPKIITEENYFFRLTRYKDQLLTLIQQKGFIQPEFRVSELTHMLEELQDISVSRPKTSVSWGLPVPNDPDQVIYVWIDALSNYLTGIGFRHNEPQYQQYWPADCHMIGKDILRFHALYWPAMLMSAEVPLPKSIFAHGFITINDSKISKSLGNVVSPQALAQRFELPHADPIRYYLMTVCPFGQDGNFTENDFKTRINADLANNVGNLLNRTLNMTLKYCEGRVPHPAHALLKDVENPCQPISEGDITAIRQAMEQFQFQRAAELIIELVDRGNKWINHWEPWTLHKEGRTDELATVLYTVLDILRQVSILFSPFIPRIATDIWRQLGYTTSLSEVSWADILETPLPVGQAVCLEGPVLPRLEDDIVGAAAKKSV